jgi:phage I-like protein
MTVDPGMSQVQPMVVDSRRNPIAPQKENRKRKEKKTDILKVDPNVHRL